jgi:hypothetical protein
MRRWVAGRSPDRIFYSEALDGSHLATPDRQMAGSPPSLWITGAAANPHRLQKVGNPWWRSLSADLLQRGFVSPSVLKRSLSHRVTPRLQSPSLVGKSAVRIGAAMRLLSCDPRPRTRRRGHGVRTDPCRPGTSSASHQGRVNVAGCRQRCRLEIGHEFDMRFTSEAARFGSLVLPATSPLTASMPSTVGLCSRGAMRLAIGHAHPPLTATVRADW